LAPFWKAGWTVVAFEPDPRHHKALSTAIEGVDRVILDGRAVSSASGEMVTFYVSEESPGISGLSAFRDSHQAIGTVETVALRDVLDDQHVHLLKIDTEGFDLFVLQGYPFERSHPDVIMAEYEDHKTIPLGYRFADLVSLLVDQGYQIWVSEWHPIIRYGITHQWRRLFQYGEREPDPDGWGNVIAFKNPVEDATMLSSLVEVIRVDKPELLEQS
jgi:FkbM family methyltransferase